MFVFRLTILCNIKYNVVVGLVGLIVYQNYYEKQTRINIKINVYAKICQTGLRCGGLGFEPYLIYLTL